MAGRLTSRSVSMLGGAGSTIIPRPRLFVGRSIRCCAQVPVQQGLADLDPDVDAIWRLAKPGAIGSTKFAQKPALAYSRGTFSPYNTQVGGVGCWAGAGAGWHHDAAAGACQVGCCCCC
jgi:hypothetical protein